MNKCIVKVTVKEWSRIKFYLLFSLVIAITGCAGGVKVPHLSVAEYEDSVSGSEKVVVSKISPENGAVNKGSIIGVHGNGCGFMGFKGDRDGAIIAVRNKAALMGANYVQILNEQEPYSDGKCAHNEYRIEGNAYVLVQSDEPKTMVLSENFSHISTSHHISDYHGQTQTSVVVNNSSITGVNELRVIDNKWLFRNGFGKNGLLATHPLTPNKASEFLISVSNNKLNYTVRPHNSGNSLVEFWVGDSLIHSEVISDKQWHRKRLNLPQGTDEVLMKHHATGWSFEYLYWDILE